MIGFQAFLAQMLSVVVPALILVALIGLAVRQGESWRSKRPVLRFLEAIVLIVVAGMTVLAAERMFSQYKAHTRLRKLRIESVKSIRVENYVIGDRQGQTEIVRSLNDEEWFSSSHGGWARRVSFVLVLDDGSNVTYQVAVYLKEEGAVIFFEPDGSGYAFSRNLPSALARAGFHLPT